MPKSKNKLAINLNLLRPQSNPEKLPTMILRWLLSSGRYIFVFVEALVLIAFFARFKLDADLQSKKEAIEEQIPYIENLRPYEILIRQTQLKLSTMADAKKNSENWATVLEKIANQTPVNSKINGINIAKSAKDTTVRINSETKINSDLANFAAGLKEDSTFSNVNILSVGLEQGVIKYTIEASTKLVNSGGKVNEE